jgi:hypothetical protein
MKRVSAADTSALWMAVGQQPYDRAIQKMVEDGWTATDLDTQAGKFVFKRDKQTATLYLKRTEVGMVAVHVLESGRHTQIPIEDLPEQTT